MVSLSLKNKTILITGSAGFIGSSLVLAVLRTVSPVTVIGIDSMNDYYDVSIKEWRLKEIEKEAGKHPEAVYRFIRGNIADRETVQVVFSEYAPDIVVNLAAQAGVRYSITNPEAYIESNLIGFYNILEACRHSYDGGKTGVEHLVYASSSSVYGSNKKVPYSTEDRVDNPVSLYAATKKSNELLAHAYSKLYNIPSTGLRFFTVYGPAGRPDMAYFGFTDKLLAGKTIGGPVGTNLHELLAAYLATADMSIDDVNYVNMTIPDAMAALEGGVDIQGGNIEYIAGFFGRKAISSVSRTIDAGDLAEFSQNADYVRFDHPEVVFWLNNEYNAPLMADITSLRVNETPVALKPGLEGEYIWIAPKSITKKVFS